MSSIIYGDFLYNNGNKYFCNVGCGDKKQPIVFITEYPEQLNLTGDVRKETASFEIDISQFDGTVLFNPKDIKL